MNVLCALKLSELWNTSLLFDLNYKYINGASLLALAKSIYYLPSSEKRGCFGGKKRLIFDQLVGFY